MEFEKGNFLVVDMLEQCVEIISLNLGISANSVENTSSSGDLRGGGNAETSVSNENTANSDRENNYKNNNNIKSSQSSQSIHSELQYMSNNILAQKQLELLCDIDETVRGLVVCNLDPRRYALSSLSNLEHSYFYLFYSFRFCACA